MITENERNLILEEAALDYEWAKIENSLRMIDIRESLNKRCAEIKVLQESGTNEDLIYLFTEAENETESDKKGVLASIIDAITRFFKMVAEFISNIGKHEKQADNNTVVEVDSAVVEQSKKNKEAAEELKKDKLFTLPNLVKVLGTLGIGTAVVYGGNKVRLHMKEYNELKADNEDYLNIIKELTGNVSKNKKDANLVSSILTKLKSGANNAFSCIKSLGNGLKKSVGGKEYNKSYKDYINKAKEKNNGGVAKAMELVKMGEAKESTDDFFEMLHGYEEMMR